MANMIHDILSKWAYLLLVSLTLLLISGRQVLAQQALDKTDLEVKYQQSAAQIRQNYDQNFIRLSQSAQNHYAPRMYRLTGEYYYAEQSGSEIYQITDRLTYYQQNLKSKDWREQQAQKMIDNLPKTRRGKLRSKAFQGSGDKRFALYLIYQMAKLNEYGLQHPGHDQFVAYLKQVDLNGLLMSESFIHAYAAQVANYVYWLKYLQIEDWTGQLQAAFAKAYPDSNDGKLKKNAFNNKLYGLTHIILADSNYYQSYVSAQKHQWILDYFAKNADRIVTKSKEDIQAEVGLCFLLTKQWDSAVLAQMQATIHAAIDPKHVMIPSVKGNTNLSLGEHRNILAFALLNWPKELHQGPFPLQDKKLKKNLPLIYQQ